MAHYHGYQRTDGSIQQRILPLLTPIWEDHELNDISFLKADTFSWQSGSVYQAVYQHLESDIFGKTLTSETISGITIQYYLANDGHKICPVSEESNVDSLFNLVGVAKYFILDTDNTRFKVYREKYNKYSTELPVKGNGLTLGLTNGTDNFGAIYSNNGKYATMNVPSYGTSVDGVNTGTATMTDGKHIGLTTDSTKSGIISSSVSDDDMILYFYVGEFTQSAVEQTAGLNSELFNQKQDLTIPHIIQCVETTTGGYIVYSNGYYEEWGKVIADSNVNHSITFAKTFKNNPNIQVTLNGYIDNSGTASNFGIAQIAGSARNISTTTFNLHTSTSTYVTTGGWCWLAKGFLAEGEY